MQSQSTEAIAFRTRSRTAAVAGRTTAGDVLAAMPRLTTSTASGEALGGIQLDVEDAKLYIAQVKREFLDRPQVYTLFTEILKAYKVRQIDELMVVRLASNLFSGNQMLLLGFNMFLPYHMMTAMEQMAPQQDAEQEDGGEEQPSPGSTDEEFDHAIQYVVEVKRRFGNDSQGYATFLDILNSYDKNESDLNEVVGNVHDLFVKDHPDLLREFVWFLPDALQEEVKGRLAL